MTDKKGTSTEHMMLNRAVSYIRTEEGQKEPKGSGGKLKWFHERRPGREQRARRAGGGLRGREAARALAN